MSAQTSGSDAKANGGAAHRTHHDGSNDRAYTVEQKAAVIRVRKCSPTAFYDILGLESERTTVTDAGIKKAYRKLSLLTHPDKNGYTGADEAFKMVSRAFQILSDVDKKSRYDKFGGDPDNRFSSAQASSPFSGFARSPSAAGGGMWEDEISAEDLFRQFFGGGMPMGGGLFNAGPGFVFNLGGGPGIRVHQFGGGRPRRRPATAGARRENEPPPTVLSTLKNLLPILLLFLFPLLTSLFSSGGSTSSGSHFPSFSLEVPRPPYDLAHKSNRLGIMYYVRAEDVTDWGAKKWRDLDAYAEQRLAGNLAAQCQIEVDTQDQIVRDAQGWFWADTEKLRAARRYEKKSCKRLASYGYTTPRSSYTWLS